MEIEERDRQLTEIAELLHPNPWKSEYPYVDSPEPPPTCGRTFATGGSDSSMTECDNEDLDHGSKGIKHEGPCPFGTEGRVRWRGGGSIEGDRLPVTDVEWID